jgi:hypothetical protein
LVAALRADFLGSPDFLKEGDMTPASVKSSSEGANVFIQWLGVLGGPVAWAMQLQANYALVPHACKTGQTRWLHLSTIFFLLLALCAVAAARHAWKASKRTLPASGDSAEARSSFMGRLGVLNSGLFALVIIAQAIPILFFDPCEQ